MRHPTPHGVNRGFGGQAGLELIRAPSGESADQAPSGKVFAGEYLAWECCRIVVDGVVHEDAFFAPGFYLLIASGKKLSHQARRVAAVIGLALTLAAIIAFLSLRLAKQFGRLSVPPLYDDVSYFVEAARAERGANQRHCGESWRAPSPACAVLEFDRYHWLDPHSRRLCRTIRHQCRHSAGVPAWYRSPDMAAAVRGYCDVSGRCGVCTSVLAHHDGSSARPAVGSGPRLGYRISSLSTIPATQPLVGVWPWRVLRSCRRHQAIGFSRLPHLHRIGGRRAAGLRVPGSGRRWISRSHQAGRSAGADLCGWAAGGHVRN